MIQLSKYQQIKRFRLQRVWIVKAISAETGTKFDALKLDLVI